MKEPQAEEAVISIHGCSSKHAMFLFVYFCCTQEHWFWMQAGQVALVILLIFLSIFYFAFVFSILSRRKEATTNDEDRLCRRY